VIGYVPEFLFLLPVGPQPVWAGQHGAVEHVDGGPELLPKACFQSVIHFTTPGID
jgi:hypothetical protein